MRQVVTTGVAVVPVAGAVPGLGQTAATLSPPAAGQGLTGEQQQALAFAHRRGKKVRRAAGVAAFSGYTMAVFAVLTLLTGLFDVTSFVLGIGLAVVAHLELQGGRKMKRLDLSAPRHLGLNQIALGAMLVLYGAWSIIQTVTGPGMYDQYLTAGGPMADMLEPISRLQTMVTVLVYGTVIAVGIFGQGSTALYYFTRARHLRAYLAETPAWIIQMQRVV